MPANQGTADLEKGKADLSVEMLPKDTEHFCTRTNEEVRRKIQAV